MRVDVERLRRFASLAFEHAGAPTNYAEIAADVLVAADRRGIPSHGVRRLPWYISRLREGAVVAGAKPIVLSDSGNALAIDAAGGLGMVGARFAMERVISKAAASGVAVATVRNSSHFGIAAYYAMLALPHRMIGIAMTNAHARVAAPGGATAIVGTNPLAFAVPTPAPPPFVLDMATSVRALGAVETARDAGDPLPEGWVVDAQGRPITDPAAALKSGLLLPLGGDTITGGYKGFGLGILVDLLCGPLTGALFGRHVGAGAAHPGVGHVLAAWHVPSFRSWADYLADAGALLEQVRAAPRYDGRDRTVVPGEIEDASVAEADRSGVPLDARTMSALESVAADDAHCRLLHVENNS